MAVKKNLRNVELQDLSTFGGRLTYIAKKYYRSIAGLAVKLGQSESTVRGWAAGTSQPRVDDIAKICDVTGTRIEWLVYGRGEQEASKSIDDSRAKAVGSLPVDHALLASVMQSVDEHLDSEEIEISPAKRAEIVAELYDSFKERGVDKAKVVRLIRLVARP